MQTDLMQKVHKLRHDIFIQAVGREDLSHWNKFEFDVWDTGLFGSVHVLLEDDHGVPIGVARLVLSEQTTMLEANHPEFLNVPHDKSPDLWEIQRLGVRLDMDPIKIERAILFLLSKISLWFLARGVTRVMLLTYTGIAKKRLEKMQAMGGEHMLVGAPHVALQGDLDRDEIRLWLERYRALTNRPAIEHPYQHAA